MHVLFNFYFIFILFLCHLKEARSAHAAQMRIFLKVSKKNYEELNFGNSQPLGCAFAITTIFFPSIFFGETIFGKMKGKISRDERSHLNPVC